MTKPTRNYNEIRKSETPAMNIRIASPEDGNEKGVYYPETRQTWISLAKHISDQDIDDTMMEESIHLAIRDDSYGMRDESIHMNIEQEEQMIEKMFWVLAEWFD